MPDGSKPLPIAPILHFRRWVRRGGPDGLAHDPGDINRRDPAAATYRSPPGPLPLPATIPTEGSKLALWTRGATERCSEWVAWARYSGPIPGSRAMSVPGGPADSWPGRYELGRPKIRPNPSPVRCGARDSLKQAN